MSLEEEQLEEVIGGFGCLSCFKRGQKKQIQPESQPGDYGLIGRTASGHRVYDNAYAAQEALDAESHPQNWRIDVGSVHTPTESIVRRGGYALRPREQPSVSHTTQQR
jgi:hypothetical protein